MNKTKCLFYTLFCFFLSPEGAGLPGQDELVNIQKDYNVRSKRQIDCPVSRNIIINGTEYIIDYDYYCSFYNVRGTDINCKTCDDTEDLIDFCDEHNGKSNCRYSFILRSIRTSNFLVGLNSNSVFFKYGPDQRYLFLLLADQMYD